MRIANKYIKLSSSYLPRTPAFIWQKNEEKRKGIRVGKSISEPKKKVTLLEKDVDDDQYEFLKKYITNMDYVMSQP